MSECVITYDGAPSYSVSIMEFANGQWSTRRSTSPTPSVRLNGGRSWQSQCRAGTSPEPDLDRDGPVEQKLRLSITGHRLRVPSSRREFLEGKTMEPGTLTCQRWFWTPRDRPD